jgi:hypothetical protein
MGLPTRCASKSTIQIFAAYDVAHSLLNIDFIQTTQYWETTKRNVREPVGKRIGLVKYNCKDANLQNNDMPTNKAKGNFCQTTMNTVYQLHPTCPLKKIHLHFAAQQHLT